jgi:hypothetical protein
MTTVVGTPVTPSTVYTTLSAIQELLVPDGTIGTNGTDDGVIERMIDGASRYIDSETKRTFYARTETRLFDCPSGRTLWLDDDLLSITTLTNGDGVVITSTDYVLEAPNRYPKYAICLRDTSSLTWQPTSAGSYEQAISVLGTWGWLSSPTASVPPDIKMATEQIVVAAYHRRMGQNMTSTSTVTAAGVVITPEDIPAFARRVISLHTRMHFHGT